MDIGSKAGYPASALSNFAPHKFIIDGVECNSMEGFLQSLKFKDPNMQVEVCKLVGLAAKYKGKSKKWWQTQTLYWRGVSYARSSSEYQDLLDKAYQCMFDQSEGFRNALKACGKNATFTHSIGKSNQNQTVLTTSEFCRRLLNLKNSLYIN
jgi:predicted NAD-dependent protein-ADP-ribosyltransferase YbiA (DUF1768 family)